MEHPLVELARGALRRVAAAPPAEELARAGLAELEEIDRQPLVIAIGGEPAARARLFDAVCGEPLFGEPGPERRAVLRVRRGERPGFRATKDDGSLEDHEQPPAHTAAQEAARARSEAARHEVEAHATAIDRIDHALPPIVRTRPAVWALWLWPVYWIVRWLRRGPLAERRTAERTIDDARRRLAASEHEAQTLEAEARRAHARYREALRALAASATVTAIELTVAAGPLPEGVELVEGVEAWGLELDATTLLASPASSLAPLPALAADARALVIGRRTGAALLAARTAIGGALEEAETGFRARLARIERLRIADPAAYSVAQLARVQGEITSSVSAVLEHASVHLGSELAQLQAEWIGAVAGTTTPDELKAAVTRITEAWDGAARRVAEEVRVLVAGGLGGSVRDLQPGLIAPLRDFGLPDEHARPLRAAPTLPPLQILPSLDGTASKLGAPGWLAGLFRSFENRRTSVREKVHERIEHLKEVAAAELRDVEPRLQATIADALRAQLALALQHQAAAVEAAVIAEQVAIGRDREELAPVARISHVAGEDLERLSAAMARIERERRRQPAA